MKQIELLAPVGKFENAMAAIENGANAIFVGGKMFSARYYADNFGDDELEQIVNYCKLRGVQVHVTVNTLIKEQEMPQLVTYLKYLYQLGVDAIIIQDLGIAHIVKRYFKGFVLHASTQMSAHSIEDVAYLQEDGFERVVLAREVGLQDVKKIKASVPIEIETFIHGALCYSYSGQCLMSSLIGGRSGNRGRCAQPCRMTYTLYKEGQALVEDVYMLSPKDIATLNILPQLIESGIDSFKIEGRMKSPEYVAVVTSVYRKYIDLAQNNPKQFKIDPEDMSKLQSIFNRGGFSEGYYLKKPSRKMLADQTPKNIGLKIGHVVGYNKKTRMATFYTNKALHPGDGLEIWNTKKHTGTGISKQYEADTTFTIPVNEAVEVGVPVYLSKNHELLKELKRTYQKAVRSQTIEIVVEAKLNQPITVTFICGQHRVTVKGDEVELAKNQPMTKEDLSKQLTKLGNTPFVCTQFSCELEEGGYVSVSRLNALRRCAVEALEEAILAQPVKEVCVYEPAKVAYTPAPHQYIAHVRTLEQLEASLGCEGINGIYWEWQYDDVTAKKAQALCAAKEQPFYLALPLIVKEEMWQDYGKALSAWEEEAIAGYLVRNYGTYHFLRDSKKARILDYTFNLMNNEAIAYWYEKGATRMNISMELSKKELKQLEGPLEFIVYGHIPVMTSEQCVLGNYKHCKKNRKGQESYYLEDRKQAKWPVLTDCTACKMQLLADTPLYIEKEQMKHLPAITTHRVLFTIENKASVAEILDSILKGQTLKRQTQQGTFYKAID